MLSNGPHTSTSMLGNGLHVRIMSFEIMSHSIEIMSHLGLCRSGICHIRDDVAFGILSFVLTSFLIMSFGFMLSRIMLFGILSDGVSNCSVYHNQSPKNSYSLVFVHESGGSLTTPVLTADR